MYYLNYGLAPYLWGISKDCENLSILCYFEKKIMESMCAGGSNLFFSDSLCCYYFLLFMIVILRTMVIFVQHEFTQAW